MSDNPYAASTTRLSREVMDEDEVVLASRFKRLVARIIDAILNLVVFLLCIYFIPSLWEHYIGAFTVAPDDASATPSGALQSLWIAADFSLFFLAEFLLGIAIVFLVQGYFLAQYGQTIGKMALNVKIVDKEDLKKPTLTRLFVIRECGMSVIGLIPLLSLIDVLWIFGSARRCLHDHWSQTIVVDA